MTKYDTNFKLQVVKRFLAGDGVAKLLARRWAVPEEKIRTWVSHYRQHGVAGLAPKRSAYSAEFKLQVLDYQDREQLSNRQVAAIYDIRNANQVAVWRQKVARDGIAALQNRRGRPTEMASERCAAVPPKTKPKAPMGALREENERLRAEVAYLKKLHALVRAKRSAQPTRRVPSSD